MKLIMGCGYEKRPGYQTVDINPEYKPDFIADLTKPLPFEDNSVEAIWCSHVLEHLTDAEGVGLAREMARILQPGGVLEIAVPDLEEVCRLYVKGSEEMRWTRLDPMIYGSQETPWQIHKTGYTKMRVAALGRLADLLPRRITQVDHGQSLFVIPTVYAKFVKRQSSTTPMEPQESSLGSLTESAT